MMRNGTMWLICCLLLSCASPATSRDLDIRPTSADAKVVVKHWSSDQELFQHRVLDLLEKRDFGTLESMSAQAWQKELRLDGGDWLLQAFYPAFVIDLKEKDTAAVEHRKVLVQEWISARPQSVQARVALLGIDLHLNMYSLDKRAPFFEYWKKRFAFQARQDELRERALQLLKRSDLDAEVLNQISNVIVVDSLSNNGDAIGAARLIKRAAKLKPEYHHTFLGVITKALPAMRGSATEVKKMLRVIGDSLPENEGHEFYFRFAARILGSYGSREYALLNLDWSEIQSGFAVVNARWPDSEVHRHNYTALAYLHGKAEVVQQQLTSKPIVWDDTAEQVWHSKHTLGLVYDWSVKEYSRREIDFGRSELTRAFYAVETLDEFALHWYLFLGGNPSVFDEKGISLLQFAIDQGERYFINALIRAGADVEHDDGFGWRAVHYAASFKDDETLTLLAKEKARFDLKTAGGRSPLSLVASSPDTGMVQWVFERAPEMLNIASEDGWTPLMRAAERGRVATLEMFLAAEGIEVNRQTNDGDSALHLAARKGYVKSSRALLKGGANPELKNNTGNTALMLAQEAGVPALVELLQSY